MSKNMYKPNIKLRQAREDRAWTQEQLAERVGVRPVTVLRWEHGESFPPPTARARLCETFEMNEEELGIVNKPAKKPAREQKLPDEPALIAAHDDTIYAGLSPTPTTPTLLPPAFGRERQRLIERVRSVWIEGVLAHSLPGGVLIELGLEEQLELVKNPWEQMLERPTAPRPVGSGNLTISQIYQTSWGELLILGEPGAGKTTLLLQLAKNLLIEADRTPTAPVPVVFNLASWQPKLTFFDYLLDELHHRYQISRKLGRQWLETYEIVPLLDGLDEMPSELLPKCIAALNEFRCEYGTMATVICCRLLDYKRQLVRLQAEIAVLIQPLSPAQIQTLLTKLGPSHTRLALLLQAEPQLEKLAASPLMLNLMSVVYAGDEETPYLTPTLSVPLQSQIFELYFNKMLVRRGTSNLYSPTQIRRYFCYLARQMQNHSHSVLYLEQLQPSWLETRDLQFRFTLISSTALGGLWGFALGGLLGSLLGSTTEVLDHNLLNLHRDGVELGAIGGPILGLFIGLVLGCLYGLVSRKVISEEIKPAEQLVWSWRLLLSSWPWAVVIGALSVPTFNLVIGQYHQSGLMTFRGAEKFTHWGLYELIAVLWATAIYLVRARLQAFKLDSSSFRKRIGNGALLGLPIGLILTILDGYWSGPDYQHLIRHIQFAVPNVGGDILGGALAGCWGGLLFGILGAASKRTLEPTLRQRPNQGIMNSLNNALYIGSVWGGVVAVLFTLLSTLSFGWLVGITSGLSIGLSFGLLNGGTAALRHAVLRYVLWKADLVPFDLPAFLNFTASKLLMSRVGAGYSLLHPVFQEYFARTSK